MEVYSRDTAGDYRNIQLSYNHVISVFKMQQTSTAFSSWGLYGVFIDMCVELRILLQFRPANTAIVMQIELDLDQLEHPGTVFIFIIAQAKPPHEEKFNRFEMVYAQGNYKRLLQY